MTIFPGESVRGKYKPLAITLLIIANILVYFYTSIDSESPLLASSTESILELGFKPIYAFTDPFKALMKTFTSMFVHADLFHIFFNMYFLWLFGSRIEGLIGHKKTLLLYFLSGLSAVLFHIAFTPVGGYDALVIPAVGASGAISGILGAYLLMLPYTRLVMCIFYLLIPFCFRLPALAFLLIWFAEQVIYGYMKLGGVAYFAHIGGFVMGLALAPLLVKNIARRPSYLEHVQRYFAELYGIQLTKPRGIGRGAKIILTLLLIGVVAGFLYGAYMSTKSLVYALDVNAGTPGVVQSDQIVLAVVNGEALVSTSQYDYVRVLINRLAPLLYNTKYSKVVLTNEFYSYTVRISGIPIAVRLSIEKAEYDEYGVAVYMKGTMETTIVQIGYGRAERGGEITLGFTTNAYSVDITLLAALSIIAVAICVFGVSAVIRGDEVAVFSQPSLPEIFPYI